MKSQDKERDFAPYHIRKKQIKVTASEKERASYDILRKRLGMTGSNLIHTLVHMAVTSKIGDQVILGVSETIMDELQTMHPALEIIIHADPVIVNINGSKIKLLDREPPRFY